MMATIMPEKEWTIVVLNHSHTDIGFTAEQHIIKARHVDYIRQVINILSQEEAAGITDGYKWNCETFWSIEEFLRKASREEVDDFIRYAKEGKIGLSASYLNFTELLDYDIVYNLIKRAVHFAEANNLDIDTAMTADINGYSWGFSQALYNNGIQNLYSCTHSHHGMFPIGRRQYPFYWQTPAGDKILVWNGDHYMFGNDLGIGPVHGDFIDDELDVKSMDPFNVAEIRIPRYLKQLEAEDYPFDFVPLTVSGKIVDNAPPNIDIIKMIEKWNDLYGDKITLKMGTLSDVFKRIRKTNIEIPEYKGDWPDWWSDGIVSTAGSTSIFRQAQRSFKYYQQLANRYNVTRNENVKKAEKLLALYAEHTWGHHQSVSHPYLNEVKVISETKRQYAVQAYNYIQEMIHDLLFSKGVFHPQLVDSRDITVYNPMSYPVESIYEFPITESASDDRKIVAVVDEQVQAEQYHDRENNKLYIDLSLEPGQVKKVRLNTVSFDKQISRSSFDMRGNISNRAKSGIAVDTISKSKHSADVHSGEHYLETPYLRLEWEAEKGITRWFDKKNKTDLLSRQRNHSPFTPVYEVNPAVNEKDMIDVRVKMGRNRKTAGVNRYIGKFTGVRSIDTNDLFTKVELEYLSAGVKHYILELRVHNTKPEVDCTVRFLKESNWEAENIYISLPFSANAAQDNCLWLDKAGSAVRPWIDQLPGTLTDFYCVQNGCALTSQNNGLSIATPGTPLLQVGDIKYKNRLLQGAEELETSEQRLYAWVLSNYWETNFKAEVGGFYQFRFLLKWGIELKDSEKALAVCRELNTVLPYYYR